MSISMRETHLPSCVPPSLPLRLKGFQVPQSEPFSIRAHVLGAAHNASDQEKKRPTTKVLFIFWRAGLIVDVALHCRHQSL